MLNTVRPAATVMLALALASAAHAVKSETWRSHGLEGFAKGKLNGVSITARGWLRLAPPQKELPRPAALFVWALAEDSKGNVYLGTGTKGAIYRVDGSGKLSMHFATGEMNVHALAVDSKDNLYAGTSPHGLVYRIAPDGAGTILHRTGSVYVWDLAVAAGDKLLVATGKKGTLLRLTPSEPAPANEPTGRERAKAEVLYTGPDTHILCLLDDPKLGILAGTAPSGLLLQIDPKGKPHVLMDADEPEIHDVVKDDQGRLFVVTASGGPGTPSNGKPTPADAKPKDAGAPGAPEEREPGENSVYMIEPDDGRVVRALGVKKTSMFAAAYTREGGVFIGTGDEGNLVRMAPGLGLELLLDLPERQILCLLPTRSGDLLVGTGNGASVVTVSRGFRAQGEYVSEPLDSRWGAQWGRLTWSGMAPDKAAVVFATRSGNTEKPDATWTPWTDVKADANHRAILTRGGRYLQYRARFTTTDHKKSPVVEEVALSYLPRNLPPDVKEVTIGPRRDGSGGEEPKNSAKKPDADRSPTLHLSWTVLDPNSDPLRHTVFFRREGDKLWTQLVKDLETATYDWDTTDMPDGRYRVLVRVSDAAGNPASTAGTSERISDPFSIDNSRPRVTGLKGRDAGGGRIELSGRIYDETSKIVRIEYAIGNGVWRPVAPEDGIVDARSESIVFRTAPLQAGVYYIRLRATDEAGNRGVAHVTTSVSGGKR